MKTKFILLMLLSLTFAYQPAKATGDVTNAIGTTVALSAGIAAGYFSKMLFYENEGFLGSTSTRIAKDWTRDLCRQIKCLIDNNNRASAPMGDEMKNYILGLRVATGILACCLVKALY